MDFQWRKVESQWIEVDFDFQLSTCRKLQLFLISLNRLPLWPKRKRLDKKKDHQEVACWSKALV